MLANECKEECTQQCKEDTTTDMWFHAPPNARSVVVTVFFAAANATQQNATQP